MRRPASSVIKTLLLSLVCWIIFTTSVVPLSATNGATDKSTVPENGVIWVEGTFPTESSVATPFGCPGCSDAALVAAASAEVFAAVAEVPEAVADPAAASSEVCAAVAEVPAAVADPAAASSEVCAAAAEVSEAVADPAAASSEVYAAVAEVPAAVADPAAASSEVCAAVAEAPAAVADPAAASSEVYAAVAEFKAAPIAAIAVSTACCPIGAAGAVGRVAMLCKVQAAFGTVPVTDKVFPPGWVSLKIY